MAKETVEKERIVEETVTETETLWRCDDCQREFDEEELVPVAVAPEGKKIGKDVLSRRVRDELQEAVLWKRNYEETLSVPSVSRSPGKQEMYQEFEWACDDVAWNLLKEVEDGRSYDAASVLDVCKECLKDDFGIEVEEHDGRLFEERNYNETIEKTGLGKWERKFLTVITVFILYQFYMLGAAGGPRMYAVPLLLFVGGFLYWSMG